MVEGIYIVVWKEPQLTLGCYSDEDGIMENTVEKRRTGPRTERHDGKEKKTSIRDHGV